MFQSRLHDENTNAHLGQNAPNKDVLMSAKKTAFSDVKNLMNTNTPNVSLKPSVSGLKKPVFGSKFMANNATKVTPTEAGPPQPVRLLQTRNYKPRIDLSSIDYSENEPHIGCKSSSTNQRDILYDFWTTSSNFEIYKEDPLPEMNEMPTIAPAATHHNHLDDPEPLPEFSSISFDDF